MKRALATASELCVQDPPPHSCYLSQALDWHGRSGDSERHAGLRRGAVK